MKGIAYKNLIYGQSSDRRVEQIGGITTNADYEILLSGTANDNYYIGETRKTDSLTYNPNTNRFINMGSSSVPAEIRVLDVYNADPYFTKSLQISATDIMLTGFGTGIGSNTWDGTNISLKSAISNKVSKSGDTLTDSLYAKFDNIDISKANNNVSSIQYPTTFSLLDTASRIMTRVEGVINPNGNVGSFWYVRNYDTSGELVAQKGIAMNMDKSGTLNYTIADAANFRSAINAVNKAGDVITGQLDAKNSNVTIGTTSNNGVTSSTYQGYRVVDSNNTVISHFLTGAYTNGDVKTYLQTYNTKTNGTRVDNMLSVGVRKNGSLFYEVSSPSAFRDALQLGNMALQDGAHFTQLSVASFDFKATTANKAGSTTATKAGWTFVCWIACYSTGHTLAGDCYFEFPQNATTNIWSRSGGFTANSTIIKGLALFMQAGGLEIIA